MSDKIEDGGPAFPLREEDGGGGYYQHVGMSLRDWFAGQALAGWLARNHLADENESAVLAYIVADAMLAERKEKP
jgi:hypothetical protein